MSCREKPCVVCGKPCYAGSNFLSYAERFTCGDECHHKNRMYLQKRRRLLAAIEQLKAKVKQGLWFAEHQLLRKEQKLEKLQASVFTAVKTDHTGIKTSGRSEMMPARSSRHQKRDRRK